MKKSRTNIKKNKRNFSKFKIYGGMKLNVESYLKGLNVTLDVEPTDTIKSIKFKIINKLGVDPSRFYKLTYNDNELSDSQTISSYGIPENSNLLFKRHIPGFILTEEERDKKSAKHKFGICIDCDNGLDDRADWIIVEKKGLLCNACNAYYTEGETDGYVDGLNGDDPADILKVGDVCTIKNCDFIKNFGYEEKIGEIVTILYIYDDLQVELGKMCICRYHNKQLGNKHDDFGPNTGEIPLRCLYLNDTDESDDIQDICRRTMWSKDLKMGDRVITCGESIYSDTDKVPVPLGVIGTIVNIVYRYKDTPNPEIQYKVKFDDYKPLDDMEHLYWCHNLRRSK